MDQPNHEDMERLIDRLPETETERRLVKHLVIRDPSCGIKDEWVTPEMTFCRRLESVVLSGVPDTSDKTVVRLARDNPNIQGVDLTGCKYVSDVGINELVSQAPPLQWLQLSGVVLTDPTVSGIAKTFSKLVELELCNEPLLSAVSVRDIWTYSRKLRVLRVARCPLLTDKALPCPIKKGGGPATGSDKPLPHRPSTWLDGLPPLILRHTAVDLRVLDLSYCTKLTDEGIQGVLVHAPSLHTLSLAGCTNLTDRSVEHICKLGVQLGAVTLAHVWQVTDGGIVKLARACLGLKSVDLAFCRLLTDLSVFELAGLENLHRLVLVRVPKLTDNAIYYLGEHARSLERLHLSYCDRISLKAIHHLLRNGPRLNHLTATGVPAARRMGLSRFSDCAPETMSGEQQSAFRVFSGQNLKGLCRFLDKEKVRREQAEARNIPFIARSDDKMELY